MLPESDRHRGIPASAYDLSNQIKEGITLEQCPSYITLSGVHGADVATRLANAFQSTVENARVEELRRKNLEVLTKPISTTPPPAPASE